MSAVDTIVDDSLDAYRLDALEDLSDDQIIELKKIVTMSLERRAARAKALLAEIEPQPKKRGPRKQKAAEAKK